MDDRGSGAGLALSFLVTQLVLVVASASTWAYAAVIAAMVAAAAALPTRPASRVTA